MGILRGLKMNIDQFLTEQKIFYCTYEHKLEILECKLNKCAPFEADDIMEEISTLKDFFTKESISPSNFRLGIDTIYFAKQDILSRNETYDFKLIYKTYLSTLKKDYSHFVIV